jgi:glycosyltransferase involved in cell wall biosynthesis
MSSPTVRLAIDAPPGLHVGPELTALMLSLEAHRQQPGSVVPLLPPSASVAYLEEADKVRVRQLYTERQVHLAEWAQPSATPINATLLRFLGAQLRSYPASQPRRFAHQMGIAALTDTACDAATLTRGRAHDALLAGSAWQAALLQSAGLTNVREWHAGVDVSHFKPRPHAALAPGRFVIWSCARLDWRKGQDLVLAAFKAFRARHPDALLVTAWQHPIPEMATPFHGLAVDRGLPDLRGGLWQIVPWLEAQGIPADSVVDVGLIANSQMPTLLSGVDVAVFASRAEAEPSRALLECHASAVPAIVAANTGQTDMARLEWCLPLAADRPLTRAPATLRGTDGWGEVAVDDLVEALEQVYQDRAAARSRALAASREMVRRGWNPQVRALLRLAAEATSSLRRSA